MTSRTVARKYAHALFDVATKDGRVDEVARDLAAFEALVSSNGELSRVLVTPVVPAAQKKAIVEALLAQAGDVTGDVRRLLLLLAERDRLTLLADVAATFADRRLDADRVVRAEIITATPLDAATRSALVEALGRAVGRTVTITERVDTSLIGGVVAKVGSVVFDGSVIRQLERMRQALMTQAQA